MAAQPDWVRTLLDMHPDRDVPLRIDPDAFSHWRLEEVKDAAWSERRYFVYIPLRENGVVNNHIYLLYSYYMTKSTVDTLHAMLVKAFPPKVDPPTAAVPTKRPSDATPPVQPKRAAAAGEVAVLDIVSISPRAAEEIGHRSEVAVLDFVSIYESVMGADFLRQPPDVGSVSGVEGTSVFAAEASPAASHRLLCDVGDEACSLFVGTIPRSDIEDLVILLFKNYQMRFSPNVLNIHRGFFSITKIWRQPWFWTALCKAGICMEIDLHKKIFFGEPCKNVQFVRFSDYSESVFYKTPHSAVENSKLACMFLEAALNCDSDVDNSDTISVADASSLVKAVFESFTYSNPDVDIESIFFTKTNIWRQPWFLPAMYDARTYILFDPKVRNEFDKVKFTRFQDCKKSRRRHVTYDIARRCHQIACLHVDGLLQSGL